MAKVQVYFRCWGQRAFCTPATVPVHTFKHSSQTYYFLHETVLICSGNIRELSSRIIIMQSICETDCLQEGRESFLSLCMRSRSLFQLTAVLHTQIHCCAKILGFHSHIICKETPQHGRKQPSERKQRFFQVSRWSESLRVEAWVTVLGKEEITICKKWWGKGAWLVQLTDNSGTRPALCTPQSHRKTLCIHCGFTALSHRAQDTIRSWTLIRICQSICGLTNRVPRSFLIGEN